MSTQHPQIKVSKRAVSDHRLAAKWRRWEVNSSTMISLYLQEGSGGGCSFKGCIEIATFLLPKVRFIMVFNGSKLDNFYYAERDGKKLKWSSKPGLDRLGLTEAKKPTTRLKS